jgi:hypothetical protein
MIGELAEIIMELLFKAAMAYPIWAAIILAAFAICLLKQPASRRS